MWLDLYKNWYNYCQGIKDAPKKIWAPYVLGHTRDTGKRVLELKLELELEFQ